MAKFIILYKGPATDMSEMSEEQSNEIMAKWQAWIEKMGNNLLDVGSPMAPGASVVDDGSEGSPLDLNGYSIIKSDDLEDAKSLVADHPFLSDKTGDFSVEVHELMPIDM